MQQPSQINQKEHFKASVTPQSQQPSVNSQNSILLKINGDVNDPIKLWVLRITVFLIVLMILLLKMALPSTYITINNQISFRDNHQFCNPSIFDASYKVICSNFSSSNPKVGLFLKNLAAANQFVLYYFDLHMNSTTAQKFNLNQTITLQTFQLAIVPIKNTKNSQLYVLKSIFNQTTPYDLNIKQMYQSEKRNNHYLQLFAYDRISTKQTQDRMSALFVLTFSNYSQLANLTDVNIEAVSINPAFTTFTIVVRAVYCFFSIITAIFYLRRYCQIQKDHRTMEMHFIAMGSVFLIFFNDPFYAITIYKMNAASTFFSSTFVVNLFIHLLMLWIFFLRKIYYEQQQNSSDLMTPKRSWPFYLLMLGLIISITTLSLQYSYYAYENIPVIVAASLIEMKVIATIVFVAIFLIAITIYQIVMMVRIFRKYCCNGDQTEELMWRHKNYLTYYPFFFIIFLIFFMYGGAMPYNYEGAWILYGYSFLNIFMFILQFLYYVPSSQLNKPLQNIHHALQKNSISSDTVAFDPKTNSKNQHNQEVDNQNAQNQK